MTGPTITRRLALRRLTLALGGVATAPLASGLLAGCRTPAAGDLAAYEYQVLDAGQQRLLAALVDEVVPATDTPSASGAGVPQFVDTMLAEWYAPGERDAFLAGLADVDARSEGGSFVALGGAARTALATTLDAEAYAEAPAPEPVDGDVAGAAQGGTAHAQAQAEREVAGVQGELADDLDAPPPTPPFFRQLKELTLAGYYTSEVGATQELAWTPAPGRFDPNVPVDGPAWATLPWQ